MAIDAAVTITYTAWNTSTNEPQAADAANHTLKVVADGVEASPAATPADKSNGDCSLVVAADENTGTMMEVNGSSSTSDVILIPARWQNPPDPLASDVDSAGYTAGTAGAKLALIGSGKATITAPVLETDEVSIIQGDTYNNDDGRALEWTRSDSTWPTSLAGASIVLVAWAATDASVILQKAGSVITPTGTRKVRVELTHAETLLLTTLPNHYYNTKAIMPSGHHVTLARGSFPVARQAITT